MPKSQRVYFDLVESSDPRFDPLIEALLIATLAFAPLAFGAVHPLSEFIVLILVAVMLIAFRAKLLMRPDVHFVWSWTYVPLLLFVAVVVAQLLPLPAGIVKVISPQTFNLRTELLGTLPGGAEQLQRMPLSFFPEATASNLRLILALCAVYVVTINVIRRLRQVRRILGAVAIIGGGISLIALAQDLTEARKIFWLVPVEGNQAIAGPFAINNNFAQFLNLSMGAALALLLMQLDEMPYQANYTGSATAATLTRPVTRPIWMLACGVVAMAVSVPLSLSRVGMIAMGAGGLFTAVVLVTRPGMLRRAWLFLGIVLIVGVMVAMLQFEGAHAERLDDPVAVTARMDVLRGIREICRKFPLFGAGLGAFDMVFPMIDRSLTQYTPRQAENEYAQVLLETGALGASAVLVFIAGVAAAYARCVRRTPSPMASAALGLGFGLVASLAQSVVDSSQHVPAVALLVAVVSGLLISLAETSRRADAPPAQIHERASLRWRIAATVVLFGVSGWVMIEGQSVVRADLAQRRAARMERSLPPGGDFGPLLPHVQAAAELRPADARLRYALNRYRAETLLRSDPNSRDVRQARQIVDDVLANAWQAPTYALPYLLAGKLQRDVVAAEDAHRLIELAYRLCPNHPEICIEAAITSAHRSDWAEANERLNRAIALNESYRRDVIDALLRRLNQPDRAIQFASGDLTSMRQVAQHLKRQNDPLLAEASRRADELLLLRTQQPDAPAPLLVEAAVLLRQRGEHSKAAELLRRAVAVDFSSIEWRLMLAQTLHDAGQPGEALQEANKVLSHYPANAQVQELIARWQQPATVPALPPASQPGQPAFKFD